MLTTDNLFEDDELKLLYPQKHWQRKDLLESKGMFFLKDILKILGLTYGQVIRWRRRLSLNDRDIYQRYGLRKVWSHWYVRMAKFSKIYCKELFPVSKVDTAWDFNDLLSQDGYFLLGDVCRILSLKNPNVRYAGRKAEIGLIKPKKNRDYMVHMPTFSQWFQKQWLGVKR